MIVLYMDLSCRAPDRAAEADRRFPVGLDPFASLLFMFIGYRVGSVVGMILAIPIGMILINLYEAGAFDTLVWCVREVVNDFNNFRKVGGEKK